MNGFPSQPISTTARVLDFLQRFQKFLDRKGQRVDQTPWSIVERWESFVEGAEAGYHFGYYEFNNDLSVRDLLEKALCDEALEGFEQIAIIKEHVGRADARFERLLLPGVKIGGAERPWWHRGVLARAGQEYIDDMNRLYNVAVGDLSSK